MKKIPSNVQAILNASTQIKCHSEAVEELVYNALDADATSIAIRINIQENKIQIIDNGCGVSRTDFKSIGLKYMTSKFLDIPSLKSISNKYGFRGQSLANLINISKSVKVISRHEKSDETWMKVFEYGGEKEVSKCSTRPSKGTTIEITGFFYNRNIQRKSKDILSEIQNIKTVLENISLIHCRISLSLRDDSKNEILFKMHKNRDISQTLSTLYKIDVKNLQELCVEKNDYKVTAYIGNLDNEVGKHLIFLNGKHIANNSKLHKMVHNNLSKHFKLKHIQKSKIKNKNIEDETNFISKNTPDFFIFIKCPYIDYDLIEFKDWNKINVLLHKLIKFYTGDINLKPVNKLNQIEATHKAENSHTRNQVQKIMERILGTQSKKPAIPTMQNGIKGKKVKRNSKKLPVIATKRNNSKKNESVVNNKSTNNDVESRQCINNIKYSDNLVHTKHTRNEIQHTVITERSKINPSKSKAPDKIHKTNQLNNLLNNNEIHKAKKISPPAQKENIGKQMRTKRKSNFKHDFKQRKMQMKTDSAKKCDEFEMKIKQIMAQMNKGNVDMLLNKSVKVRNQNLPKRLINVSVRKQIDEIAIQSREIHRNKGTNHIQINTDAIQSNYDLLQTILNSNQRSYIQTQNRIEKTCEKNAKEHDKIVLPTKNPDKTMFDEILKISAEPMITYKSHNYYYQSTENNTSYHSHAQIQNRKRTFITDQSKDNFIIPRYDSLKCKKFKKYCKTGISKQFQTRIKSLFKQTSKLFSLKHKIMGSTCASSYTIEFTESDNYVTNSDRNILMPTSKRIDRNDTEEKRTQSAIDNDCNSINTGTYVMPSLKNNGYTISSDDHWAIYSTYTIKKPIDDEIINNTESQNQEDCNRESEMAQNFVFVSKSQECNQNEKIIYPMNVCETILNSDEVMEREFNKSFYNQLNITSNIYTVRGNNQNQLNGSVLYSNLCNEDIIEEQRHNTEEIDEQIAIQQVSYHFTISLKNYENNKNENEKTKRSPSLVSKTANNEKQNLKENKIETNLDNFHIMNRLGFLPKGLSPIFQNCQTNYVCECDVSMDYYEKEMYNNFADDVRNNAEIFEPKIQDAKEVTTKAIEKVNTRLTKDNSVLKFNGQALLGANVLGQIDEKFIAAIMKEGNKASTEFLVLFDQHAVHERIKLENNIKAYLTENQWKPVTIDAISLNLTRDEFLYLNNFKDKFEQLGLQWTVTNVTEVSIRAIPEAILGKNPRQVEKIIKAVRNLVAEEINTIKMQGGCVSLFPKSIMDLVFSEACRYAIKFGDKLSRSKCVQLLKSLSACKTPFQCAHGRPVMAVITEIKDKNSDYKINLTKIMEWKKRCLQKINKP